jgi:hypothetical protein
MDFSPDFQGRYGKAAPFEKQGRRGTSRVTIRHKTQQCRRAGHGPKLGLHAQEQSALQTPSQ